MQCFNNSDIKPSKILTVWNKKLIMLYYWTYCKTLTFQSMIDEHESFYFSKRGMNTLEFLSSTLLVPWFEMLSIIIHIHCLCSQCGCKCLCFLFLSFPFYFITVLICLLKDSICRITETLIL